MDRARLLIDRTYRPEFLALDVCRRAQGEVLDALGFGPQEQPYQVRAVGSRWRLRDYGGGARGSLLIVGAPIKRPYVWDLAPPASAVVYCLEQGFRVHLLEWARPQLGDVATGLDDYVDGLAEAVAVVTADVGGDQPILLGHSLGGTLAAIFAAVGPAQVAGLVLLGAPLCFGPGSGRFRDAVASQDGPTPAAGDLVPGSVLSQASVVASPSAFVWSRFSETAKCLAEGQALDTHLRVERWTLDEVPLPGLLMGQVLDWLYRRDLFRRGLLPIAGRKVGPGDVIAPTLAVTSAADDVAPLEAVAPFLASSPARSEIIELSHETGVGLQHLAILVGRRARADTWPRIADWAGRAAAAGG